MQFTFSGISSSSFSAPPFVHHVCCSFLLLDEKTPKGYWKDPSNCRKLFDSFAEENGFDATNVENWYTADFAALREKRVTREDHILSESLIRQKQKIHSSRGQDASETNMEEFERHCRRHTLSSDSMRNG